MAPFVFRVRTSMAYNIEAFHIGSEKFSSYSMVDAEGQDKEWIENLSKVNIFIGPNNSGKSRFLRTLFSKGDLGYRTSDIDLEGLNQLIDSTLDSLATVKKNTTDHHIESAIQEAAKQLRKTEHISNGNINKDSLINSVRRIRDIAEKVNEPNTKFDPPYERILRTTLDICNKFIRRIDELISNEFLHSRLDHQSAKRYIPILRGLRPVNGSTDSYLERTKKDYFLDMKEAETCIFTGLHLYKKAKKLLLGQRSDREKVRNFENFLSETFFQGQEVNIIP